MHKGPELALLTLTALSGIESTAARAQETPARVVSAEEPRMRGGVSLNGGVATGLVSGTVLGAGIRLGSQLRRSFGVYYQLSPLVLFENGVDASASAFLFMNSALANLTLLDVIDVGAGPSLDAVLGSSSSRPAIAGLATPPTLESGFQLGAHGRVALNLGRRDAMSGRRSGWSIGVDEHPMLLGGGHVLALTTLGFGGEWF
jgi:hypothetical protein